MKSLTYFFLLALLCIGFVQCSGPSGSLNSKEFTFEMEPVDYTIVKDSSGLREYVDFGRGDIRDTFRLEKYRFINIGDTGDINGDGFPEFVIRSLDSMGGNFWIDQQGTWSITEMYTKSEVVNVLDKKVLATFRSGYSKVTNTNGLGFYFSNPRDEYPLHSETSEICEYKIFLNNGEIIVDSLKVNRDYLKPDFEEGRYTLKDGTLNRISP